MNQEVVFETPSGQRLLPEAVGQKLGYKRVVQTPPELLEDAEKKSADVQDVEEEDAPDMVILSYGLNGDRIIYTVPGKYAKFVTRRPLDDTNAAPVPVIPDVPEATFEPLIVDAAPSTTPEPATEPAETANDLFTAPVSAPASESAPTTRRRRNAAS